MRLVDTGRAPSPPSETPADMPADMPAQSKKLIFWGRLPIVLIILLAALLRIAWLDRSPPGLAPDEASNAWNAWCMTFWGMDEHSKAWPIFYTRAFNDGRTAMLLYVMMPFQAVMGLNVWSTRLPTALAGVAAVWLLYRVVQRLGGSDRLACVAALLLAVDPTHVQHTRWGLEAALTPMLVLGSLLLWLRAIQEPEAGGRRATAVAIAAGAATGVSCYGYAAIRIYLPLMLAALLAWVIGRRQFTRRLTGGLIAFAVLFAPLIYVHLTDPAINARGRATRTWNDDDSPPVIAAKLIGRYFEHFSPKYLFMTGSTEPVLAPPEGFGALPWVWLPLMLAGLIWAWRNRAQPLARFALAAAVLYPVSDVLSAAGNANVLRTFCGSWSLDLLAALGVGLIAPAERWQPAVVGAAVANAALHIGALLWSYPYDQYVQLRRGNDIEAACRFVRPIMNDYDAVVFTSDEALYCAPQVMIGLGVTPEFFFTAPFARATATNIGGVEPDLIGQCGTIFFDVPADEVRPAIDQVLKAGSHGKSLWIVRPREVRSDDRVLETVRLTGGFARLMVVERLTVKPQ